VSGMRAMGSALAIAALGMAFCQPVDPPPVTPPRPTDPTSVAQRIPTEVIDASILSDGGMGWDAAGLQLDPGAAVARAPSPRRP
jgi:hypothetical protein